jgi:threonine/homoserine/homoserine lactone efflux protein
VNPSLELLLAGFGIGLLVAAPVGPVNILVIQRALERGFWGGLTAGIGAVVGDSLIALMAALGVTAISGAIDAHEVSIKLIGGLLLVLFGWRLYLEAPRPEQGSAGLRQADSLAIPKTFFLTVTNPGAVLGTFAIVGSVGTALGGLATYAEALALAVSVAVGSLAWWSFLSWLIAHLSHRLAERQLRQINQGAGGLLMLFGLGLIAETLIGLG